MSIAVVQRVPGSVLLEGLALEILTRRPPSLIGIAARRVLVDVVAEEHERVEITLLDEIAVGRVVALLPVLARREGEPEPVRTGSWCGEGPRSCRRRGMTGDRERVVVLLVRLETVDLDVHRVAERGDGRCGPAGDDVVHRFVAGDLPGDVDVVRWQRVVRKEARPQDHRVVQRIARRDPERERIRPDPLGDGGRGRGRGRGAARGRRRGGGRVGDRVVGRGLRSRCVVGRRRGPGVRLFGTARRQRSGHGGGEEAAARELDPCLGVPVAGCALRLVAVVGVHLESCRIVIRRAPRDTRTVAFAPLPLPSKRCIRSRRPTGRGRRVRPSTPLGRVP